MDARLRWHDGRDRGSKPLFRNGDRACLIDGKAGVPRDFPDIAVWIGDMGAIAAPGHVARRVGDCAARPGPRRHYLGHLGAGADIVRQSDPAKASKPETLDARLGAQILHRIKQHENGRAKYRESGCQYWYISGDDVPLKKK